VSNHDSGVPRPDDVAISDVVDADLGVRPQRISLNDRDAQLVLDALETPRADVVERLRKLRNRE
jgi:uncharacterized protein (DUF1778 family)